MSTHLDDARLETALRGLDAADQHLSPEQTLRKDALLASLTSATAPTVDHRIAPLRRSRRGVLRWALPAAAAAGLMGVMTLSGGPGGGDAAYASWTPGPGAVDAQTRTTAESACRDSIGETLTHLGEAPAAERPTARPTDFETVAAERRGGFLLVAMASDDGSTQTCFFDAGRPDRVEGSGGGLATPASEPPKPLSPGEIETTGPGMSSGPEGTYAYTQGRAGTDVTGVTVHSEGRSVTATVSDGWFAAWWPATWVGPNAPSPDITYDVTLRSGAVVRGIPDSVLAHTELGPTEIGDIGRGGGAGEHGSVVTVSGRAGRDVVAVVVHAGPRFARAEVQGGVFSVEFPDDGSDTSPSFDVVLADGRTLTDQRPVSE